VAINADGPDHADQTLEGGKGVAEKLKLGYPVLLDQGLTTFHDFGIIALPTTIILDPSRVITYELSGFPLEGAEAMADYLAEVLEGKKRTQAVKAGHQPNKAALRFFNMGTTSLRSKRTADGADAWFRKAVEADPEFLLPRLALGKFYAQRGDRPQARKELELALARDPASPIALCELGLVAAEEGKLEEARGLLDKALGLGLDYPACFAYGGYVYGRLGELERALQLHDEAARLAPWDHNLLLYRARTLEESNRPQEAAAAYRQALELMMKAR
jgi:tetratricopeptide (TPR) repeat protein